MSYDIRLRAYSGTTCMADTIIKVNLIPHPQVGFILPEVCLEDSYAEFIDTTKFPTTQTVNLGIYGILM